MGYRIGTGYDVHRLVPERKLILCGVEVPCELGLLGHSDADVVTHALMDALLGAAALGDIGRHFPDTDPAYAGANSLGLLGKAYECADSMALMKQVYGLIRERGYRLSNLDVVIIAQAPKLMPHIQKMRENVAAVLEADIDAISIKATTEEGLGFTGELLGIAAEAVCLLEN